MTDCSPTEVGRDRRELLSRSHIAVVDKLMEARVLICSAIDTLRKDARNDDRAVDDVAEDAAAYRELRWCERRLSTYISSELDAREAALAYGAEA